MRHAFLPLLPLLIFPLLPLVAGCNADDSAADDTSLDGFPVTPTDAAATPPGSDLAKITYPIEHVVVIVKENHTFDNYFGSFPGAAGTDTAVTSKGVVKVGRPPVQLLRDLCHTHECALGDWDGGKMDHWDVGDPRNANDQLAYDQYTEADIPNYWQYARNFTLLDHFFASMLGPSFPGHSFALSAQAGWAIDNPSQTVPWGCSDNMGTTVSILDNGSCTQKDVFPCFDYPVIPDMVPVNVTWKLYGSTEPPGFGEVWSMFNSVKHLWKSDADYKKNPNIVDLSQFQKDIDGGTLPNIVWLINQDANSEHPPLNICAGENWTVQYVNMLMKSAYWPRTAILITYDDFGGWYDHVAPPKQYGCDAQHPYGMGFRLPAMILSPYAKPGVYKNVAHQGSIPKFIETIFGMSSLHSKDPAAQDGPDTNDLTDAFDWKQQPMKPLVLTERNCLGQR